MATISLSNHVIGTDLATVEEVDTQLVIEDIPNTPPRHEIPVSVPHRSPGAVSEMSGTTAISSFSMVGAELLAEPRFLFRKLRKLYETSEEFLDHLVPENGRLNDDYQHIRDMQMPDSSFSADYRDFDTEVAVYLNGFRGDHQRYILRKAVHHKLLGPSRDSDALRCGLDLILYVANLLIFAKQAIHSDRSEKDSWDALRELDNFFPTFFLPKLNPRSDPTSSSAGDSALLRETFDLALDLRTQLAILYLERSLTEDNFNPDEVLGEVFFEAETAEGGTLIRGWNVSALGGEESALPQAFQEKVIERMNKIREFFPSDDKSMQRGDMADVDGLGANFPWDSLVLRLLGWVRSRNRELRGAIENQGGITAIVANVKTEMEKPEPVELATSAVRNSPRRKKSSFGRGRRRSSQKFDPNADVNIAVVDKLIAKERGFNSLPQPLAHDSNQEIEVQEEAPVVSEEEDEWQPPVVNEPEELSEEMNELVEGVAGPSQPPQSTADTLRLLKQGKKLDKENRTSSSLFERQANARRVAFGDGFGDDSQPALELMHKGKQPQRSSPKKRSLPVEESDDDEDAFETIPRTARVQEQRERAKRVRVGPTSSNAPPSHQPQARDEDVDYPPLEQEESPSENEAPTMTEEIPPRSTFADQRDLAQANHRTVAATRQRKQNSKWSTEAEEAMIEYMALYPRAYAQILRHDEMTYGLLQDRTQVNLKDKARNMAMLMIK
jgi:hypothetical protein